MADSMHNSKGTVSSMRVMLSWSHTTMSGQLNESDALLVPHNVWSAVCDGDLLRKVVRLVRLVRLVGQVNSMLGGWEVLHQEGVDALSFYFLFF